VNLELFAFTFVGIALVVSGMAIGVILSNRRIKGSCGGIGSVLGEEDKPCMFCGNKDDCPEEKKKNCDGADFVPEESSTL
jgi:hypothetical protein